MVKKQIIFGKPVYDVRGSHVRFDDIPFVLGDIVIFGNFETYKVIQASEKTLMSRMTPVESEELKAEYDLHILLASNRIITEGVKEELK